MFRLPLAYCWRCSLTVTAFARGGQEQVDFIEQLRNQNKLVRLAAIEEIKRRGKAANDAAPALAALLKDQEEEVRIAAAEALGKVGAESSILALTAALQDQNAQVRGNAAFALGQIGGASRKCQLEH
ncbi:MAG: HEAT repeat domain-containing protein [Pyrinomonadaceae bacterium]